MGFFRKVKKGFKKLRKAVGLPALTLGNVAKVAGAAAIGGPAGLGAAVLKSKLKSMATGGVKQVLRTKGQKLLAKKLQQLSPTGAAGAATTMPGGAPLRTSASVGRAERRSQRRAAAIPYKRRKAASLPARGTRKPPKGGKDFKALSVSWRAAGKPGRWIDWVKSH